MNTDLYKIFFEVQKKHWWFVTKKNIVLDQIKINYDKKMNSNILDIGCGSGLMLDSLKGIGNTYGMDMSDEAVHFSREIFDGVVEKGNLPDHLPFENNFFDLIVALDVIEHIDRDVDTLRAIHSSLTIGGIAIITVPAYMFMWSPFDDINEHKRRYTKNELDRKLREVGFKLQKTTYYNTLLFPIICTIRLIGNLFNRNGRSDIDMPSMQVNWILKQIFSIEKYLLRYIHLPFGVSILAVVKK